MLERFQSFTVLVAQASRYVRKLKTEEMNDFHLKSGHVSCLYYLYAKGAMTAKALCEACDEDKANISRSLDYLEEEGYVLPSAAKKRYNSPLQLTDKGREVGAQVYAKIEGILRDVSEGLTDEDRERFYKSFEIINANLQKICAKYGE